MTENYWHPPMIRAINQALLSKSENEVPVGAIIVNENKNIIAEARNAMTSSNDPSAHAEIIAIRKACSIINSHRLDGLTIIVTLEPCLMCASAISNARLKRLVFGAYDIKAGAISHGWQAFQKKSNIHKLEVISGVLERENHLIIKNFFHTIR